jgi:DNA-binding Lrp family transcriptional regulator
MSVKDIAKAMGLTRTTVTKRMERLEASGVITGYSAGVRKDFFD